MRFDYIDKRFGHAVLSLALVGTIVACVLTLPRDNNGQLGGRELASGFYTDEDAKKNRQVVMSRIKRESNEPVKTFEKVRNGVVPTKLGK